MNIDSNKKLKYQPVYRWLRYWFYTIFTICLLLISPKVVFSAELSDNPDTEEKQDSNKEISDELKRAYNLIEIVQSENRFIQQVDSTITFNLPVGIASKDPKKGEKYAVVISDIIIRNGQPFFNAYMVFQIPGSTKKLAFKGSDIPFSYSGGLKGEAKLELISDVDVDFTKNFTFRLKGEGGTYVSIDCDGFKEMAISAEIEFDSAMFVPENPDGTQKAGRLTTSIKTKVTDWNDFMVNVSIDPFQLKPLKGVGFTITNAVLDLSDLNNAEDIKFPENYSTDYFIDGNENIWRGFYIEKAEIRLPKYFKKKKNDEGTKSEKADSTKTEEADTSKSEGSGEDDRLKFYANGLFIDDFGFTAEVGAANLLSLDDGKIGKWAFSLDTINFKIEASQLVSANFNGQIKVSEFKDKNIFGYAANIGLNDSYAFQVSVADSLEMNLWMANIMLEPNSAFNITLENGAFKPTLDLNGTITINAPVDKKKPTANKLALAEIPFEGMHIQSEEPYFSIDYISFGTEQNMFSKFPISIDKIKVAFDNGRLGLELALIVNFTKPNAGGFGGKGGFTIWAKRGENSWEYDGIDIDEIAVDISKPNAFELHGKVLFIKGDSIYGDGFKGEVDAKFAKFGMKASVLFGNINDFRYWYADALIAIATGIPAGPVSIYGFGGGAYYNMKQTGVNNNQGSDIGKSSSGIIYVPTNSSALGILASVKLGMTSAKNSFNGDVKFEIAFNSTGGINQIYFTGNGYFLTGNFGLSTTGIMDKAAAFVGKSSSSAIPKDDNSAQLNGNINMVYDFPNNSFHTNLELFVNVANGKIVGTGANNKAGSGVVHIDPSDWYIRLGTPQSPNEIRILNLATMNNYFMAGKTIPEMPLPPNNVINGLGNRISSYYDQRNSSALPEGSGFALGVKYNYSTGDKRSWIFFGNFTCNLGFDMLLTNYGALSTCSNTNEPLGINGWYAQGQAYGWISAIIGLDVDLWIYKGRCTIFEAGLAALLNAKAPNPSWMMGNVAGNYNVLGGLVSGHFDFDFEIGEQCNIVAKGAEPLSGLSMISSISPGNNENDVDVFSAPQVVFNMPAEKEFEIRDERNIAHQYRLKLGQFKIKTPDGKEVNGSRSWNSKKDIATFKPTDLLPGKTKLTAVAEVSFEEKTGTTWNAVTKDNTTLTEKKEITFTTGNTPDYISTENIAVAYPRNRQFNYYKTESSKNFVKLKTGMPELFKPGIDWEQKVKVTAVSGNYNVYASLSYDVINRTANFTLPQDLPNNTIFNLQFVNVPKLKTVTNDQTTNTTVNKLSDQGNENKSTVEITTKYVEETKKIELKESVFFSMNFRASKYSSFAEKINSLNFSKWAKNEIDKNIDYYISSANGERFDSYEIENISIYKNVSASLLLNETSWLSNVYLPSISMKQTTRQHLNIGAFYCTPDVISLYVPDGTRRLNDNEAQSGYSAETDANSVIKNYIARSASYYFDQLQLRIASINKKASWYKNLEAAEKEKLNKILVSEYTSPKNGGCMLNFEYKLPTESSPNSSQKKDIEFTE